jgi:hypothetical protein
MPPQTALELSSPYVVQLGFLRGVVKKITADLTQEESLFQPATGGNCLNWIAGHVVRTRNEILAMVGQPAVWSAGEGDRYARGAAPITGPGEGVLEVSRILAAYDAAQGPILAGIEAISDQELAVKVPWFGNEIDKAGALAGLLFHETYHVGQMGLIRRLLGKDSAIGA